MHHCNNLWRIQSSMGLKCSTDYAQEVMETIFQDFEDAEVYIDDMVWCKPMWGKNS
jgi:hypothetical protein